MSAAQPSSLDLDAHDLNPKALEGLTVVITGTLPNLSRKQVQELVERAGGKVTGSISSKTNLLIAGDKAGSKLKKAAELGVEVLDEDRLLKRISNQENLNIEPRVNSYMPEIAGASDDLFSRVCRLVEDELEGSKDKDDIYICFDYIFDKIERRCKKEKYDADEDSLHEASKMLLEKLSRKENIQAWVGVGELEKGKPVKSIKTDLTRDQYLEGIIDYYINGLDSTGVGAVVDELFGPERKLNFSRWQFVAYVYDRVRSTTSPLGQKLIAATSYEEVRNHLLGLGRYGKWNAYSDESPIPKPSQVELEAVRQQEADQSRKATFEKVGNPSQGDQLLSKIKGLAGSGLSIKEAVRSAGYVDDQGVVNTSFFFEIYNEALENKIGEHALEYHLDLLLAGNNKEALPKGKYDHLTVIDGQLYENDEEHTGTLSIRYKVWETHYKDDPMHKDMWVQQIRWVNKEELEDDAGYMEWELEEDDVYNTKVILMEFKKWACLCNVDYGEALSDEKFCGHHGINPDHIDEWSTDIGQG